MRTKVSRRTLDEYAYGLFYSGLAIGGKEGLYDRDWGGVVVGAALIIAAVSGWVFGGLALRRGGSGPALSEQGDAQSDAVPSKHGADGFQAIGRQRNALCRSVAHAVLVSTLGLGLVVVGYEAIPQVHGLADVAFTLLLGFGLGLLITRPVQWLRRYSTGPAR